MRLILIVFLSFASPALAERTVAFFGLYMNDTSSQSTVQSALIPAERSAEETARIAMIETMARTRFTEEGFTLLDITPVASDLDRIVNPANCYGCDQRMAEKLGAEFILVGEITKVSDALLAINLQLRDGATGALVKAGAVDIRGNTDDTWRRGMRSILNNRIFREENK